MVENSTANSDWRQRDWIARLYYRHGLFCASNPRLILCITAVVLIICSAPLLSVPEIAGSTSEWITSSSSRIDSKNGTHPGWFVGDPLLYIQQFIVNVKLSPRESNLHPRDIILHSLEPAFQINKYLQEFAYPEEGPVQLSDLCLEIPESFGDLSLEGRRKDILGSKILPESGCLIVSPANFWGADIKRFVHDDEPVRKVMKLYGRPSFSASVKEILFGVPLEKTGLFPNKKEKSTTSLIHYTVTLVLNHHDPVYMEKLRESLEKKYAMNHCAASSKPLVDHTVHIHYKANTWTIIEMGPLCVMYFIVFLYLAFSLAKMEFVKSKVGLAFSAVMSVIFSLAMAAGSCQFLGFIPTLNSSEIFPYLVIVIGVENMLVITKSVVSTPLHLEVKTRVAEGLSKEGRSITVNLLTELGICLSGYFTYVPAIQEFCLFAVTGLLTDFFLQIVFFTTVLSIDIRRMELTDLQKQSVHNQYVRHQSQNIMETKKEISTVSTPPPTDDDLSNYKSYPPPLTSSNQGLIQASAITTTSTMEADSTPFLSILLPPLPSVPKFPKMQLAPIQEKLPKRLNFAYFWARTRFVQRACMVCAVLYFSYLAYHSFYSVTDGLNNTDSGQGDLLNLSNRTWTVDYKSPANNRDYVEITQDDLEELRIHSKTIHSTKSEVKSNIKKRSLDIPHTTETEVPESFDQVKTSIKSSETKSAGGELETEKPCFSIPGTEGELFRNLSRRYWPQLMNFYNISVFGRFITILPPVQLGSIVETSSFKRTQTSDSSSVLYQALSKQELKPSESSKPGSFSGYVQEEEDEEQISDKDAEYFLGAFYVVVLGIFVMIGLFFVCKFLNDSQIIVPRRKTHQQHSKVYSIIETVPIALMGHPQAVECLVSDGSTIVSTCLGGQIRVWNSNTGEGMAFNRNRLKNSRRRKQKKRKLSQVFNGSINTNFEEHAERMRSKSQSSSDSLSPSPGNNQSGFDFSSFLMQSELEDVFEESHLSRSWSNCWSSNSDGQDSEEYSGSECSPDEVLKERKETKSKTNSSESDEEEMNSPVWCVDVKDTLVLVGCADGSIEAWHIITGRLLSSHLNSQSGVVSLCFLHDREHFVAARLDGTIDFFSLKPLRQTAEQPPVPQRPTAHRSPRRNIITNVQHGSSQQEHACLSGDEVNYFAGCSCTWLCTVRAHHHLINVMKYKFGLLISGSQDRTLKVYRSEDATCVYTLYGHLASVTAICVSKSAALIPEVISGAADGALKAWDLRSGVCSLDMRGHRNPVVAITSNANYVISLDLEDSLRIWGRCHGNCIYKLKQRGGVCTDITLLSSDFLVSCGQGGVTVWDISTGRSVREVYLGRRDQSVLVHRVVACDNATIVCDFGNELRLVSFPGVLAKVE